MFVFFKFLFAKIHSDLILKKKFCPVYNKVLNLTDLTLQNNRLLIFKKINKLMKLLNISLLFFVLFSVQFVSYSQNVRGNGKVKKEIREVSNFNEVVLQGKFNVVLIQGQRQSVEIETDENLLELFQTYVKDNTLYLIMTAAIKKSEKLNVYISVKDINSFTLLDQIVFKSENVIHFDSLTVLMGGMSQIDLQLYAEYFNLQLYDGCYAKLTGYTETFIAHVHDETELDAFKMHSDYCNILSSGLTDCKIYVDKTLNLFVTGASNLYYMGNAKIKQRVFSSTGFIVKRQEVKKQ